MIIIKQIKTSVECCEGLWPIILNSIPIIYVKKLINALVERAKQCNLVKGEYFECIFV